jgi:uncharacterized protein YbaP (TraB family)
MKKLFVNLIAGCAVSTLLISSAYGQTNPAPASQTAPKTQKASPALWLIKDADTRIYLFGTMHLMPANLDWNHGAVKAAFETSDALQLEIADIEAEGPVIVQLMQTKGQLPPEQRISDGLTEAQKVALTAIIAQSGIPPQAVERMQPWLGSLVLSLGLFQKLGLDPKNGADKTLDALARAANKPVGGFETGAEQIGFFAGLSEEQQRAMLISTIEEWDSSSKMLQDMVAAWSSGDLERLASMMNESLRSQPALGKLLLTDRNEKWANWIAARMAQPGTIFVAVGAGHLGGPDSVQAFLAKKGLRATPVKTN